MPGFNEYEKHFDDFNDKGGKPSITVIVLIVIVLAFAWSLFNL